MFIHSEVVAATYNFRKYAFTSNMRERILTPLGTKGSLGSQWVTILNDENKKKILITIRYI